MSDTRNEFTADEIVDLLSELDKRLKRVASPWMPPLPEGALQRSDGLGLHITYATDEFLLATKLVAQRRKDAADIVALARRLHMEHASADDLEQLMHRYYTDEDSLEFILDGNDIDREIHLLAVRAERLLTNHESKSTYGMPIDGTEPPAIRRQDRTTSRERS